MTAVESHQTRSSGISYQELLDSDARPVPVELRWVSPMPPGPDFVPVERYTTKAFHELEVEKVWKRVWQMACREDDIPNVGDTFLYEIAHLKYIIVRVAKDRIKAYPNSCLHRGRQLVDNDCRKEELRCPRTGSLCAPPTTAVLPHHC